MTEFLLAPYMIPFTIALGLLFGLMALEIVAAFLGGTLLGLGGDADADFELDADAEFDVDVEAAEFSGADFGGPEIESPEAGNPEVNPGVIAWLGIGKVPLLIWLGAFLLAFGLAGLIVQSIMVQTVGFAVPAALAALAMLPIGIRFARAFSGLFARLLPKTESTAMSENHLGRRKGVISQGTAARGKPAEVRVVDRHGNTHYLRAEPLRDDQEIAQGTEVLVLRKSLDEGYRLVALTD